MAKDQTVELENRQLQHIARISHGKDSLKMLDVIVSRGLPLDRITATDVWATDTIRGEHPKMVEFKDRADEYIWGKYRIEVEHLCAMKNGEKMTYEKMFYHVPKRKEGRKEGRKGRDAGSRGQFWDFRHYGTSGAKAISKYEGLPTGFPLQRGAWCQKLKHIWVPGLRQPKRDMVPKAQNTGFLRAPPRGARKISWNIWA